MGVSTKRMWVCKQKRGDEDDEKDNIYEWVLFEKQYLRIFRCSSGSTMCIHIHTSHVGETTLQKYKS